MRMVRDHCRRADAWTVGSCAGGEEEVYAGHQAPGDAYVGSNYVLESRCDFALGISAVVEEPLHRH
jgi:hypothetical protein